MNSIALIKDLETLPKSDAVLDLDEFESKVQEITNMDRDTVAIELSEGIENSLLAIFDARNIPDKLFEAHRLYSSDYAGSLHKHYQDLVAEGKNVDSFVSGLKGKLAELEVRDMLDEQMPTHEWELAANPNQPIWDIIGKPIADGQDIFVQVKIGSEAYARTVTDAMDQHRKVFYAVGTEIFDKIEAVRPDLTERLWDTAITNMHFTREVKENIVLLSQQWGIDLPDSWAGIIPFVGEIVLGMRFLIGVVQTERDMDTVDIKDRARVHAMKALLLIPRFGIASVCTFIGGAAGQSSIPIPGVGAAAGSFAGAGASIYLNRRLRPRMLEIALALTNLGEDDLYYLQNKPTIDNIGLALASTQVA